MADVIDFPGCVAPAAGGHEAERQRLAHEFECDTAYAVEVLKANLPREALDRIAGLDLKATAGKVVLALYEAHHGRRLDPRYDERRQGGVMAALARMYHGPDGPDAPEPPASA